MYVRNALGLIVLMAAGCTANGSRSAKFEACGGADEPARAVAACSELIQSGKVDGPDLGRVRANRAVAYSELGEQDKAIADLNDALQLLPGDAQVYAMRGVARGRKGDLDAAIADFTISIDGDPSLVDSLTNRGKALQDKGEFARAIPDFDRALVLQPNNASALNGRCWSRAVLNIDLDAALADCNAGVKAGGAEPANTLNTRGFVYYRRGEYREAIASYDASIQGNPNGASSYYIRGLAKRALSESGAQADIDRALSLEPGVRERYAGYGVAP
ncbi:tetratricopeptide repeat protein [Lysobacter terrae]